MSQQDRTFFNNLIAVMGFLIVLAFVFYFIAHNVVNGGEAGDNPMATAAANENIKPIGSVTVAGESAAGATAAGPRSGADVYNAFCMACHATGAAGAPKVGDKAAWQPRFAQGMDVLLKHAVEGFQGKSGMMPPKGTCFQGEGRGRCARGRPGRRCRRWQEGLRLVLHGLPCHWCRRCAEDG